MSSVKRKIVWLFFTLYMAISSIFFAVRFAPGDPVENILGPQAQIDEIENYRQQLGLDQPGHIQYLRYMQSLFAGDLGNSLYMDIKVSTLIKDHLSPSIILAFLSIGLSGLWGTILGLYSALNKINYKDKLIRFISLAALSFPIFSLAPLLIYFFAIFIGILPVSEWGRFEHIVLPVLTLVIPLSSIMARVSRNSFLEEKSNLWVLVLSSKGMDPFNITLRVLKVILPTILNVMALQLSVVIGGTIITESIYDIPGLGMLLFNSIQSRDYPVIQGVVIYITVIYMLIYFALDLINEKIDPRLKT